MHFQIQSDSFWRFFAVDTMCHCWFESNSNALSRLNYLTDLIFESAAFPVTDALLVGRITSLTERYDSRRNNSMNDVFRHSGKCHFDGRTSQPSVAGTAVDTIVISYLTKQQLLHCDLCNLVARSADFWKSTGGWTVNSASVTSRPNFSIYQPAASQYPSVAHSSGFASIPLVAELCGVGRIETWKSLPIRGCRLPAGAANQSRRSLRAAGSAGFSRGRFSPSGCVVIVQKGVVTRYCSAPGCVYALRVHPV